MNKTAIRILPFILASIMVLASAVCVSADSSWTKTGEGTNYYAEFPSGYYTASGLYSKYHNNVLGSYENADTKREVKTERVSWIYWHWTWNASVSTGQNNKLIDDKPGYDGEHDYRFFTDFESAEGYPVWSGDDRVYEYWRNRPEDGSKWWFRIPVYKQTYIDYKLVSSEEYNDAGSNADTNPNPSNTAANSAAKKYRPKATSVNKCVPGKKSCSIGWKKCSGKCTGYQIRYCTNKKFKGCKVKTLKGKNSCICSLTGLKAGTTYYYQVRCCRKVGKKTYCSAWSKCKSFTTKKEAKTKSATTSKSKYMPTEYYVKYPRPVDGMTGADVKLSYNKYGLVTKMTVTTYYEGGYKETHTNKFKYTYNKNKSLKTAKAYIWGFRKAWSSTTFNKYGAVTGVRWGVNDPLKVKVTPVYYNETHKTKMLRADYKDPTDGIPWHVDYTFNKNGNLSASKGMNSNIKYTYDKKGRITKKGSTDRTLYRETSKYKYTFKNGRVNTRNVYYSTSNNGKNTGSALGKTITMKKWKKIKTNDSVLRSIRSSNAVWRSLFDGTDPELEIPDFIYEWK